MRTASCVHHPYVELKMANVVHRDSPTLSLIGVLSLRAGAPQGSGCNSMLVSETRPFPNAVPNGGAVRMSAKKQKALKHQRFFVILPHCAARNDAAAIVVVAVDDEGMCSRIAAGAVSDESGILSRVSADDEGKSPCTAADVVGRPPSLPALQVYIWRVFSCITTVGVPVVDGWANAHFLTRLLS